MIMAEHARVATATEAEARRRLPPQLRMPQIIEAALAEFAERGYAGARMAAVAQRAGIAKGLIYHYFHSKEALFKATVRACTQPVLTEAERRIAERPGSVRALLASLVEVAYARVAEEGARERNLFRLIFTEAEHFPELARLYEQEVFAPALAIGRAVLRAGAASGEFRPEVAEMPGLAEVIVAPAIMNSVWRMILGDAKAPAPPTMRAAHLDLLLNALSARPG